MAAEQLDDFRVNLKECVAAAAATRVDALLGAIFDCFSTAFRLMFWSFKPRHVLQNTYTFGLF